MVKINHSFFKSFFLKTLSLYLTLIEKIIRLVSISLKSKQDIEASELKNTSTTTLEKAGFEEGEERNSETDNKAKSCEAFEMVNLTTSVRSSVQIVNVKDEKIAIIAFNSDNLIVRDFILKELNKLFYQNFFSVYANVVVANVGPDIEDRKIENMRVKMHVELLSFIQQNSELIRQVL